MRHNLCATALKWRFIMPAKSLCLSCCAIARPLWLMIETRQSSRVDKGQLQPQPPVAGEALALQGAAPEGGAGQHGAEQRRVIGVQQSVQGQAAAADDEDSGCRVQR